MIKRGGGVCIENPAPKPDEPSIFHLQEYERLAALGGLRLLKGHQCMYGAETTKPTAFAWSNGGVVAASM
eukprot:2941332-Amphidinium_carterae.1